MQELRVIGVENGALLVASDDGERFRIPIDEVLQSRLRQASPEPGVGRKLSPREIQEQIRSGMSASDVASVTGMSVEYIEKYERPILAEREHIVEMALDVPVHLAMDTGPVGATGMTFGTAIRSRLSAINALGERWASWKEASSGWVVKLAFTADQIDHDARWTFDPKRLTLSPLNSEATTLSQQGDVPTALVPRLRAVASSDRGSEEARFDSGAFVPVAREENQATAEVSRFAPRTAPLASDSNQTADLLDALRRRRGEREAAPAAEEYVDETPVVNPLHPSTGSIRIVDVPMPEFASTSDDSSPADDDLEGQKATLPQPGLPGRSSKRKGRASLPSWDDIVFGARPEDGA